MSLGYAERLSFREDLGGRLGDPEVFDSSQVVLQKIEQLTELVSTAVHRSHPPAADWSLSSSYQRKCLA